MADFSQTLSENTGTTNTTQKESQKPLTQSLGTLDTFVRVLDGGRSFSQTIGMDESLSTTLFRFLSQSVDETIGGIDSLPKPTPSIFLSENIGTVDTDGLRKSAIRGITKIRGLL